MYTDRVFLFQKRDHKGSTMVQCLPHGVLGFGLLRGSPQKTLQSSSLVFLRNTPNFWTTPRLLLEFTMAHSGQKIEFGLGGFRVQGFGCTQEDPEP